MTVQLRSLRVDAAVDASKYVAGMNQKVAADKQGAASSAEVAQALVQQDRQAERSAGVLTRLSRQYVEGYGAAARFEQAMAALGRGIEKGAIPAERVSAILDGIYRKFGMTANAASLMEAGQTQLATAVAAANAKLEQQEGAANGAATAMLRHASASKASAFQLNNLRYQMFDVVQMLALGQNPMMTLMQQGPQIAQIYGPQEGGVARAFKEMGNMVVGAAAKFPLLTAAIALAGVGIVGLRHEINETGKTTVSFGNVIKAVFQNLGAGISSALSPLAPIMQWVWDRIVEGAKLTINFLLGNFAAVAVDLKFIFTQFPNIVATAIGGAANLVVVGIEKMVAFAAAAIDKLITAINTVMQKAPDFMQPEGGFKLDKIGEIKLGRVNLGTAPDELAKAVAQRNKDVEGALNRDYAGEYYNDIAGRARKNALDDEKSKKGGQSAANAYRDLIKSADDRIAQMRLEAEVAGLNGIAADALRFKLDLLQKGEEKGRSLSPDQIAEIEKKAEAYKKYAEQAARATLQQDLLFEREQLGRSAIDQTIAETLRGAGLPIDFNSFEAGLIRANEQMKIAKDLAKGFFDDFRAGLEQGKSFWQAFGDAALNALDKIVDKLLDDVLNALLQVNNAGSGGGGLLSGLLGMLGMGGGASLSPAAWNVVSSGGMTGLFANGGAFAGGVQMFANGGAFTNSVVSRPTLFPFANGTGLMGEAGPEAIMPLRRDGSGRLGVSAANDRAANNNQPAQYVDQRTYHFTGTSEEFEEFKKFVAHRDAQFDDRAVQAVKRYHKSGNSI